MVIDVEGLHGEGVEESLPEDGAAALVGVGTGEMTVLIAGLFHAEAAGGVSAGDSTFPFAVCLPAGDGPEVDGVAEGDGVTPLRLPGGAGAALLQHPVEG